ncbi:MAG: GNAT family N-acetyltransferase [Minisyncoccia bacterium]
MNQDTFEKVLKISEEYFSSNTDPNQMPINKDSEQKLLSIHTDTIIYKLDEKEEPIAWAVVVPTSTETMTSFLEKKITERELLDIAAKEKKFDALYLCAVFVLPEHRRKGYAKELLLNAIEKIPNSDKATLYAWIYSDEGKKLVEALTKETGRKILIKKG